MFKKGWQKNKYINFFNEIISFKFLTDLIMPKDIFAFIKSLNIKEGSEVITPALTFSTTVSPIVHSKLIPVFLDIDYETLQIDISKIYKGLPKKFIFPQLRIFYFRLAVWFYAIKDRFNV